MSNNVQTMNSLRKTKETKFLRKIRKGIKEEAWFSPDLNTFVSNFSSLDSSKVRVTVWGSDGIVLYDNVDGTTSGDLKINYGKLNNHGTRLEGQVALMTRKGGFAVRTSATTGQKYHYWAVWLSNTSTSEMRCCRLALSA